MHRKIMHVIYSLYPGGAERLIELLLRESERDDFEIIVCSLTGGGEPARAIEEAGGRVVMLGKRHRGDLTALVKLAGLIRRERVDLLHLHNSPGAMWGTLAALLGGITVPIVRTEHRPYHPSTFPAAMKLLYPFLSMRTSRTICVADSVRKSFTDRYPKLENMFITIHNGIRISAFENLPSRSACRQRFGLPADGTIVGTVGRFVPVKNHRDLIEAFRVVRSRVKDAHLAIAGEGPLAGELTSLAGRIGLKTSVSIVPPSAEIEQFYGALDCFALSSRSEGLPLALLEALAAGLPVVATRVGGIPEIIDQGVTGCMVPQSSPSSLAERITELLLDREKASAMGERGRETVRKRFSARDMTASVEAVYDNLLS